MRLPDTLTAVLSRVLRDHGLQGFQFIEPNADTPTELSRTSDKLRFQITPVRSPSIDAVRGMLAMRVLGLQRFGDNTVPLLLFKRLGAKVKRETRLFMSTYAPGCAWGLIDESGAAQIVVPALSVDIDQSGQIETPAWPRQRPMRLFTDLNQWMLKILLLADAPSSLWGGPRQQVATPTELHRVAKVSLEKAHQFVRAFEQLGFFRPTRRGLNVVRRRELMEMWFHDERSHSSPRIPVRWIFGQPRSMQEVFLKSGSTERFAVCGFEACHLLGVLHTPVAQREVYFLGDADSVLAAWDLEPCDGRDAHFFLQKARCAQSILRGRIFRADLPVVDVLQAALDTHHQEARGIEQAQYILDGVLGWKEDR